MSKELFLVRLQAIAAWRDRVFRVVRFSVGQLPVQRAAVGDAARLNFGQGSTAMSCGTSSGNNPPQGGMMPTKIVAGGIPMPADSGP